MIENYPAVGVSIHDRLKVFFVSPKNGVIIEMGNSKSYYDGYIGDRWDMGCFREAPTPPKELALLMLAHME